MTSIPKFLIDLSVAMNAQSNRHTQLPLFVVQEKVKVYGAADWTSEIERNSETDQECEDCNEKREKNDGELPETCETEECPDEAFNHFNWEWKEQLHHGVFLTGAECDAYIERRRYEFGKEVRSYAISSYWSREMGEVLAWLSSLTTKDGKPVSQYRV